MGNRIIKSTLCMSIKHAYSFGRDSPISLMKYCNFLIINRCFSMYEISRRNEFSFCLAKTNDTRQCSYNTIRFFFFYLFARATVAYLSRATNNNITASHDAITRHNETWFSQKEFKVNDHRVVIQFSLKTTRGWCRTTQLQ